MISSSAVQYKKMMSLKCQYIFSILSLTARFMPEHDLIEISGRLLSASTGACSDIPYAIIRMMKTINNVL